MKQSLIDAPMQNDTDSFDQLFTHPGVHTIVSPLYGSIDDLLPQERMMVASAVEKRQREFATARLVVRQQLAKLGVDCYPLLNDADRVPIWPENVIGSISHCDEYCLVAILEKNSHLLSIGVDIEPDNPIEENLWSTFATGTELEQLKSRDQFNLGRYVHLLFSAKEAVYKCIFPSTRKIIEFQDVEIEFDFNTNEFYPVILDPDISRQLDNTTLVGRFLRTDGFIYAACSLQPDRPIA